MASSITPPSLLFAPSCDKPERDYVRQLAGLLFKTGKFDKFIEPICGAFVMAGLAREAGFTAAQIECSDSNLWSNIVGAFCGGQDLASLGIKIDGEPIALTADPLLDAGTLLMLQARIRFEGRAPIYWENIRHDLASNAKHHLEKICENLAALKKRLDGITFEGADPWTHIRRHAQDPAAVIVLNPPRRKYPKDFFASDRLTWNAPADTAWQKTDYQKLMDEAKSWAATLLVQQEAVAKSHGETVIYARAMAGAKNLYYWTNRPEQVLPLFPMVAKPRVISEFQPLSYSTIPKGYVIKPTSKVAIALIKPINAGWYKELWVHRINWRPCAYQFAIYLDGFLVGIAGYDDRFIPPTALVKKYKGNLLLTYAFGAPHPKRLTRLATTIALTRQAVETILKPWYANQVTGFITIEFTKKPTHPLLRGLMKLKEQGETPDGGKKLIYGCDIREETIQQSFDDWYTKELTWQQERKEQEILRNRHKQSLTIPAA